MKSIYPCKTTVYLWQLRGSLSLILLASFFYYTKESVYWNSQFYPLIFQTITMSVGFVNIIMGLSIRRSGIRWTKLDILVIAFLLYNIFRRLLSIQSIDHDNKTYLYISYLVVYLIIRSLFTNKKLIREAILLFVLAALFNCLLGFLQILKIYPTATEDFLMTGAFVNPGQLGGFIAPVIPLSFLIAKQNSRYSKHLYIAGSLLVIALVLTGSRTAIVSSLLVMAIYFYRKINLGLKPLHYIVMAVLFLVCMFAIYKVRTDSVSGRFLIWKVAIEMIDTDFIYGKGMGYIEAKYNLYQSEYFCSGQGTEKEKYLASNNFYVFNEYLKVFIEAGLIGIILFITIIISVFQIFIKKRQYLMTAALTGSLCIIFLFSLFSYPFETIPISVLFYALIALLVNCSRPKTLSVGTTDRQGLIFVFSLIVAGFITFSSVHTIAATFRWSEAFKKLREGHSEALENYKEFYSSLSNNHYFLYNYGAELANDRQFNRAIAVFEHMKQYHNDSYLYSQIARCYIGLQKYKQAQDSFSTAICIVPTALNPKFLLFDLLRSTNQHEPAKKQALEIINTPVKVPTAQAVAIKREAEIYLDERNAN